MAKMVNAFVGITGAGQTAALSISTDAARGRDEITVQVEITGTVSVDIECRLSSAYSWVKVQTGITANSIVRIGDCGEVRLNNTAGSGTTGGGIFI